MFFMNDVVLLAREVGWKDRKNQVEIKQVAKNTVTTYTVIS